MNSRHLLSLSDLSKLDIERLIERAIVLKRWRETGHKPIILESKVLIMIFEEPSTRTRVAFEVAMNELGGSTVFLSSKDSQLGRGEPIEDTARVLSRMANIIMIRTDAHETVQKLAKFSDVPVINGLTNDYHPCQLLADLTTFFEHRGDITGKTVAWIGDGNNMCNSYIEASKIMGFSLKIACPSAYRPKLGKEDSNVSFVSDARSAAEDSDLVVTDVWLSMGQRNEKNFSKHKNFREFQVDMNIFDFAKSDALFMHCLPAHRGEEVSNSVIEHPRSVVWDEAGNRLHSQKAVLEFLLASE